MNLYHYTSVGLAGGITSSNLSMGYYDSQRHGVIKPVVWFTTSPESNGHGLLTGKPLSASDKAFTKRIYGVVPKNDTTLDKTKIRITIRAERLEPYSEVGGVVHGLIPYEKFSKRLGEDAVFRKHLGLAGFYKLNELELPADEMRRLSKRVKTKEGTWWLHFGGISPHLFEAVEYSTSSGFVPYDFEAHGRREYAKVGMHWVSSKPLKEFHELCTPENPFDYPMACCFCESPQDLPAVGFRYGEKHWRISLQEPMNATPVKGDLPHNIQAIIGWVKVHHAELEQLWSAAVDSYYEYYPSHLTGSPVI